MRTVKIELTSCDTSTRRHLNEHLPGIPGTIRPPALVTCVCVFLPLFSGPAEMLQNALDGNFMKPIRETNGRPTLRQGSTSQDLGKSDVLLDLTWNLGRDSPLNVRFDSVSVPKAEVTEKADDKHKKSLTTAEQRPSDRSARKHKHPHTWCSHPGRRSAEKAKVQWVHDADVDDDDDDDDYDHDHEDEGDDGEDDDDEYEYDDDDHYHHHDYGGGGDENDGATGKFPPIQPSPPFPTLGLVTTLTTTVTTGEDGANNNNNSSSSSSSSSSGSNNNTKVILRAGDTAGQSCCIQATGFCPVRSVVWRRMGSLVGADAHGRGPLFSLCGPRRESSAQGVWVGQSKSGATAREL
ncbi:hypothetical protein PoB_000199000 [Plakobranchus ocellatus]|uniref:Uncharacterized protein n=1 Tax=Plakobranchus ocellatus TaxID=259542 RepID=A0AAV3XXG7_9GAST|nr:hypothetical protein PoB_000199000 [Plakobranchus ocellatus]